MRDYFRRAVASGLPAFHASCYVIGELDGPDMASSESRGMKICRPFVIEGKGVTWTIRFLSVLGNGGLIDLTDDEELSTCIAYRPFVGVAVEPPPIPGRPHRAIQIESFEPLAPEFAAATGSEWNGKQICRPDPRGR